MTINNILGQPAESFDPNLAAIQELTLGAIEQINHSKRDPRAVEAMQELGRRMVEAVTDVDRVYGLAQYLTDLQLVVKGPGQFNLFINEVDKQQKAIPIHFGREQRSIQIDEDTHGKQESRDSGPRPGSSPAAGGTGETPHSGAEGSGGAGPVTPSVEAVPRITELLS